MNKRIRAWRGTARAAAAAALVTGGAAAWPATATAQVSGVAVVTAAAARLPGWPVLREGRNVNWPPATVRSLQYLLNAHGARLAVDGQFGPKTKAAVVGFQRTHSLAATGVVAAATCEKLIITVRIGSTGQTVRAVQDQANFRNLRNGHTLVVDGIFGPKTEAWVRGFQRAMASEIPRFSVDGIVGPQTWRALVSEALSG